MPFISDAQLRKAVASAVGVDVSELADRWDELISAANEAAANEIVTKLSARGFTVGQIDAWDRRAEFNRSLGLFFVGSDAGFMTAYSPVWVEMHDRRPELAAMECITVGRVLVYPANKTSDGGGTQVTGGQLAGSVPGRDWTDTEF